MYRAILFCALAVSVSALPASAGWAVIEDFDSYSLGELDGQGGWQTEATGLYSVATDPIHAGNQVMAVATGADNRYARNSTYVGLNVPEGTTGTLYFRIRREVTGAHMGIGLSDDASPTDWGNYEVQFRSEGGDFDVRDAGSFDELATGTPIQEWYEFWMVADNAADTTKVYVQSPTAFPAQTLLDHGGQTDFAFRNGTSAALSTLFLNAGAGHTGPWLVDDVQFDAAGENLASPTAVSASYYQAFANSFDVDAAGFTPIDGNEGGSSNDGQWQVAGGVYSQTNSNLANGSGSRLGAYSLADPVVPGFRLNVDVRLDDQNGAGDAGIVFGWQDNANYYYVLFNESASNNDLFVVQDGTRTELVADFMSGFTVGQFYHMELERHLENGLIVLSVDGTEVLRTLDLTFGAGRVGIGAYNDAASFDNFVLETRDVPEPASMVLVGLASAGVLGYVRRRRA